MLILEKKEVKYVAQQAINAVLNMIIDKKESPKSDTSHYHENYNYDQEQKIQIFLVLIV